MVRCCFKTGVCYTISNIMCKLMDNQEDQFRHKISIASDLILNYFSAINCLRLLLLFQIPSQHFLRPWLRTSSFLFSFLLFCSLFIHLLLLFFIPLPLFHSNILSFLTVPLRSFLSFCCLFVYLLFSFPSPIPYSFFPIPFLSS